MTLVSHQRHRPHLPCTTHESPRSPHNTPCPKQLPKRLGFRPLYTVDGCCSGSAGSGDTYTPNQVDTCPLPPTDPQPPRSSLTREGLKETAAIV